MLCPGFVAALFLSFVSANVLPRAPLGRCGTVISAESIAKAEDHFASLKSLNKLSADRNVTIPVVFHVISQNDTLKDGDVPDTQVAAQMDVLNADYASTGIYFELVNTTRTTNATWFNDVASGSRAETDAKTALRVGGPETLNVYTVGFTGNLLGTLGFSTFPFRYADAPKLDGVTVLFSSLPNGTTLHYNLGRTLTHEVGHWVGLYHTFQGGCADPGDSVADTPPEVGPAFGCPVGRDSCKNDTLPDPITNFMDYSDDSCMTEFTPGQAARLMDQIAVYRQL